jgi:preprotein translocase subunit SecG
MGDTMDERVAKYLKTYGILVAFLALIVLLGEFRYLGVLTGLLTLICIVLVCAVLIQQGKGGGLVGALGGMSGDTMFGTTATPVKKFTAALGILFIAAVICLGRARRVGPVVTAPARVPEKSTSEPMMPVKSSPPVGRPAGEIPIPAAVPSETKSEEPAPKDATPAKASETPKPASAPAAEAPKTSKQSESPAPKPTTPAKAADKPKPESKP